MEEILTIFITGILVLIGAIILNIAAHSLGIVTWYDLILGMRSIGLNFLSKVNLISWIFLIIIYPLALGAVAFYFTKLVTG